MVDECPALMTHPQILQLADGSPTRATIIAHTLQAVVVKSYVTASPFLTPCHGRGCDGLVVWNALDVRVRCAGCHGEYCPQDRCQLPMHAPVACADFMLWADLGGCIDLGTKVCAEASVGASVGMWVARLALTQHSRGVVCRPCSV